MLKRLIKFLRQPMVQKVVLWLAPILFSWIMAKFDKKNSKTSKKR